jgi:hypothetical protein
MPTSNIELYKLNKAYKKISEKTLLLAVTGPAATEAEATAAAATGTAAAATRAAATGTAPQEEQLRRQ